MNASQRQAWLLAVIGFLPPACHGPSVRNSVEHYLLVLCFLIGMFGLGWFLATYRR